MAIREITGESIFFCDGVAERDEFSNLFNCFATAFTDEALMKYYAILMETATDLHFKELLRQSPRDIELYKFFKESFGVLFHRLVLGIRYTHQRSPSVRKLTTLHFRGIVQAFFPVKQLGNVKAGNDAAMQSKAELIGLIDKSIEEVLMGLQDDRQTIMREWLKLVPEG